MDRRHRIYFIPGMFGFGNLAGYDYFHHVREALTLRFEAAGIPLETVVVPTPPTSSLRHRARILAKRVHETVGDDAPVHLIGHSTGGLDTRLVLSPSTNLGIDAKLLDWTPRVASAVTMNCPHYGTPLAGYFATVSGTRLLYALSLFTVISLSIGEPSLAIFSRLLSGLGGVESLLGDDLRMVRRGTDLMLRFVDKKGRSEMLRFLGKIRIDQGGIIQITPEAIDLFNAAAEDHPNVSYGCIATAAPSPRPMRFARRLWHPYAAMTAAIYSTLYQFTSQNPRMYPYATPSTEQDAMLGWCTSDKITARSNDGVVPTLSMLWGKLIWCGEGDHLDVLGHFHDDAKPVRHVDWMMSGAHFNRQRFDSAMDATAAFLIDSA